MEGKTLLTQIASPAVRNDETVKHSLLYITRKTTNMFQKFCFQKVRFLLFQTKQFYLDNNRLSQKIEPSKKFQTLHGL